MRQVLVPTSNSEGGKRNLPVVPKASTQENRLEGAKTRVTGKTTSPVKRPEEGFTWLKDPEVSASRPDMVLDDQRHNNAEKERPAKRNQKKEELGMLSY